MFTQRLSWIAAVALSLVCYGTPSLAQLCQGAACLTLDPQLPLFEGRTPLCNAAVVSNSARHMNCENVAYGYAVSSAGPNTSTRLYLGIQANVNAGALTTNPSFKAGLTQDYGYLLAAPDGHPSSRPLYRTLNCGVHTDEVTTNPGHRLCQTALIGYTAGAPQAPPVLPNARPLTLEELTRCGTWMPPTAFPLGAGRKPTPVVIVGGTQAAHVLYWVLEDRLKNDGYIVQFFPLPGNGSIDINQSADFLSCAVDLVLNATGAQKVHLMGHSQGGIVARTYIYRRSAENKVESMISLASPHQGTVVTTGRFLEYLIPTLLGCYQGNPNLPLPCTQLAPGSPLLQQINTRPANDPIYYTNFVTQDDHWVVPIMNGFMRDSCNPTSLPGQAPRCNNVLIQDAPHCPGLRVDHIGLVFSGAVYSGVKTTLGHFPMSFVCSAG